MHTKELSLEDMLSIHLYQDTYRSYSILEVKDKLISLGFTVNETYDPDWDVYSVMVHYHGELWGESSNHLEESAVFNAAVECGKNLYGN